MRVPKGFIKSKNPLVHELNKNQRNQSPSIIDPVIKKGVPYCGWCTDNPLIGKRRKYCSDECGNSANAFLNPSTYVGLILHSQKYKCNICHYDYGPHFETIKDLYSKIGISYGTHLYPSKEASSWHINAVKSLILKKYSKKAIEIDHIIAIGNGGDGFGWDNLQAICRECHLKKTKEDLALMKLRPKGVKKTKAKKAKKKK